MSGRETILNSIRSGLVRHRASLEALATGASHVPPPYVHERAADVLAQFERELATLDVQTHRTGTREEALAVIASILQREAATSVLAWDEEQIGIPGFAALLQMKRIEWLGPPDPGARRPAGALAKAEVGVTGVDVAIAESGTLVVVTGAGRSRLASLLAPVHVAVVREHQVVRGLGEAIVQLRARYGPSLFHDRSNVTCITGPSRTADIELTLTLGVHGPRALDVIVVP